MTMPFRFLIKLHYLIIIKVSEPKQFKMSNLDEKIVEISASMACPQKSISKNDKIKINVQKQVNTLTCTHVHSHAHVHS